MEKSYRKVVILKTYRAYHAYGEMIHYYAVKNIIDYMLNNKKSSFKSVRDALKGRRVSEWINLGGQIIRDKDVDKLRASIGSGKLKTWKDIHKKYDTLWNQYPLERQKHAYATLCLISGSKDLSKDQWLKALDRSVVSQEYIRDQVYISRKKDYDNHFHQATFRNTDEMIAAIGTIDDNSFIKQVRAETVAYKKLVAQIKKRG
jgi:hypothetical protein